MLPGIGIFGHGPMVGLVITFFRKNGFKIEAIWSPNERLASEARNQFQVPFSSSIIDQVLLLPAVHLIVIICPPHYHSQIASKACGIGKHVVCGWPPAYTIQEMRTMHLAAANYPSLITLIVTALRFVPGFAVMRKLIVDDQLIGTVKIINGSVFCDALSLHEQNSINSDKFMGGGLLSLYGINLIDIITFTTGLRARRVHATIRSNLSQFSVGEQQNTTIISRNADDFVSFQMEMSRPVVPPPAVPVRSNGTNGRKQRSVHTSFGSFSSFSSTSSFSSLPQAECPNGIESGNSVIANLVLNGLHYNQPPVTELTVYGTNGYLICRDGNLYGRLRQPQLASNSDSQQTSPRSSSSKLSTLYLDDCDMEDLLGLNESMFDVTSHGLNGHSSDTSAFTSLLLQQSAPVWPSLYQQGIFRMITALKQAFFGRTAAAKLQNRNSINVEKLNHNQVIVDHRNLANNNNDNNNNNSFEETNGSSVMVTAEQPSTNGHSATNGIAIEDGKEDEDNFENRNSKHEVLPLVLSPTAEDNEIHWVKEPVNDAANFEEALYLQTVLDSIKQSADTNQWIRIRY